MLHCGANVRSILTAAVIFTFPKLPQEGAESGSNSVQNMLFLLETEQCLLVLWGGGRGQYRCKYFVGMDSSKTRFTKKVNTSRFLVIMASY